jgi:hypothetical protein
MLAIFYYLFTLTRIVVTTCNIKVSFFYTNRKLCGTIEACFKIFQVLKNVKAKIVLYVLMIILQFGQTIYQDNNG